MAISKPRQSEQEKSAALYRDRWARLFTEPRAVNFTKGAVINGYCAQCGLCCGPQKESGPFPMALLDRQISARTPDDFYLLDRHTACLDERGCKALGPTGCRLERSLRPVACNIFPFVLMVNGLYLYRLCPVTVLTPEKKLQALALQVQGWLNEMAKEDIRRIAISRSPWDLTEKYLQLHVPVQGR